MQSGAVEGILTRVQVSAKRLQGKDSLELIEEATQVLRTAPLSALAGYYTGTLPFVLAALYFWGDMSQSAFAERHIVEAALGLAVVFIWMKVWQAHFAWRLRRAIGERTATDVTDQSAAVASASPIRRWGRAVASQLILQPFGLFLVATGLVLVIPFGWVFAFFQNVTVLGMSDATAAPPLIGKAARLARLWPKQNHLALLILSGFGCFAFLNLATFVYLLPNLIKMLFGVESVFTRSGMSMLNSTFFAAIAGLTYLCVDPLVKAVYTLRCFYGESLQSGEDLKVELRQAATAGTATIAAALLLLFAPGGTASALAASAPGDAPATPSAAAARPGTGRLPTPELDQAIRRTIQHRKYTWRAPRQKVVEADDVSEQGLLGRFLARVRKLLAKWAHALGDWLDKFMRRLFQSRRTVSPTTPGYTWMIWLQLLLYLLIAAAVAGLGFLLYRTLRDRHRRAAVIASEAIQPPPDLTDQNVGADQLPEDGWTRLARELWARGEWRLALRAFYLASLADLAARRLISLAKFKSNREYERELRRRAQNSSDLVGWFGETVSMFDRVWYGRQEINGELVGQFAATVDRIKGAGAS